MTDVAHLAVHRPPWLRALRWGIVSLFFAVLFSWGISLWYPHRVMLIRGRTYQLVMANGTMQFRVTTRTEVIGGVVREVGPYPDVDGGLRIGLLPENGVRITLSPWKAYSHNTMSLGREIPVDSNGGLDYLFAGETTSVHAIPHWLAAAVLAIPTAWVLLDLRHTRARSRAAAGLCIHCGYDLRATPDRCPECGTIPRIASAK